MEQVEVVLADPAPVVISGFRNFIERHPRIKVLREATTLHALEEALAAKAGCVSIVNWQLLSLEVVTRIAAKSKLILSAVPENMGVHRHALRAGARGFIDKDLSAADIRRAVLTVGCGQISIGRTTVEALVNDQLCGSLVQTTYADRVAQLTTREKQVIQVACQGLKSRAIALALRISEPTVAHHLTSIYSKLEVKDRVGLIIYAYQNSLQILDIQTSSNDRNDGLRVTGHRQVCRTAW